METTTMTSKGQVTIPKSVRQQLGLRQGAKVAFVVGRRPCGTAAGGAHAGDAEERLRHGESHRPRRAA
jgi:AbrB family looped-hinge helix DNA binding protein